MFTVEKEAHAQVRFSSFRELCKVDFFFFFFLCCSFWCVQAEAQKKKDEAEVQVRCPPGPAVRSVLEAGRTSLKPEDKWISRLMLRRRHNPCWLAGFFFGTFCTLLNSSTFVICYLFMLWLKVWFLRPHHILCHFLKDLIWFTVCLTSITDKTCGFFFFFFTINLWGKQTKYKQLQHKLLYRQKLLIK